MASIGKRTRESKRISKDHLTKSRLADIGKRITLQKMAGWVNTAFTVAYVVQQIRDLLENDLPTMVRAALRQLGLSYTPQDELTIEGFTGVVARDTGIPFSDLSNIEATREDIELFAGAEIRAATGLNVTNLTPESIREVFANAAIQHAQSTAPNALMSLKFAKQMQHAARDAYRDGLTASLGMPFGQRLARWSHREAVRKYGQSHVQEWSFEDITYKRKLKAYGNRYHTFWTAKLSKKMWKKNVVQWRRRIKGLPAESIIFMNSPDAPGITPHLSTDWVTITELNRLRKRNGLRPLVRRGSHPFRWANAGENLGRHLRR